MAAWPALLLFVSAMPLAAQDDYGDAPLPYPTLLSANGARHRVTPGFFLGTGVTTETNGQPDVDASLDVGDDGVTFLSPLLAGNTNVVRVVASANGRLDAWIDFNNNGSWSDPGEQVFRSVLLSPGANDLTFFIPAGAVGRTYARFRFSTAGELAPTGFASDGEVEDYRINILNSAADLAISAIISPDPVPAIGGRCTINVVNLGPSTASNVIVSNTLNDAKILSARLVTGTSNTTQLDALNLTLGDLQPGESRSLVIAFRPLQQAILTETVMVRSGVFDPNPNNNHATVSARAAPSLVIITPPQDQKVIVGGTATFTVEAKGAGDLSFQWFVNSNAVPTGAGPSFTIFNVQQSAQVSVKISDAFGSIVSRSALLTAITPVQISRQPIGVSVPHDSPFQLIAEADGTAPVHYQWRLNGANIGAPSTGPILTVQHAKRMDAGTYTLVVGNDAGLRFTETARVICSDIPVYPGSDPLAGATPLPPPGMNVFEGQVQGDTSNATTESGEPDHDGRPGGASVWYQWQGPAGLLTLDTIGSTFDTLLAVYERNASQALVPVVSDDDSGGYFRSLVRFNAKQGVIYYIAIDGLGGRSGNAVLGWNLQSPSQDLPIIVTQPRSQAGLAGSKITLAVVANGSASNPVTYQWYFNGSLLQGVTRPTLVLSNFNRDLVGTYNVRVFNSAGLFVESKPAIVEVGPVAGIVSRDKLEDLFLNSSGGSGLMAPLGPGAPPFVSVSMGVPGAQVLNSTNSTADIDCFLISSATRWLGLQVTAAAPPGSVLRIDTAGSAIATELAGYQFASLSCFQSFACMHANLIGCDTNSSGGGYAVLNFKPVPAGQYIVFADGIDGAMGIINFNWQLGLPPILDSTKSNCTLLYPTGAVVTLQSGFTNGIPTPRYQWYYCGASLANETNGTLSFNPIQAPDAGCYSVVASNFAGVATNTCCVIVDPPVLKYAADWEAYPPTCNVFASLLPATILESTLDVTPVIAWQSVITNAFTNCAFRYVSPLYDGYGDPVPQCFFRTRKP